MMNNKAIFPGASIAIIGAGVVGTASALELVQRGYAVTVLDPFPPGQGGASWRNAGHIGASDVHPLATPGIASTGLKLMLGKDSPLRIPGIGKIRLIPWFMRFLATSRGAKYRNACSAMTFLCQSALDETATMLATAGIPEKMTRGGAGYIYDSAKSLAASKAAWKEKAAAGFGSQGMDRADIARHLPEMNAKFRHGMISLNWACVTDPLDIVQGLAGAARSLGVVFDPEKVTGLEPLQNGVRIFTATGQQRFDAVVVAAGVRSKPFATALGDNLPLIAERGYNLTFPDPGFALKMPLILPDRGIAITQLSEGLRIGGWAEYTASPDRPENKSCYKALARISAEIFPGLNQTGAIAWMGNRPALPDSVPVISKSSGNDSVFFNCGHGHYGLTHAAASAHILGGLVDGSQVPRAHTAYAIGRFN
jgi:D-amino-acid dehydrogenase